MKHEIIEKHGCTVVYGTISVPKMCRMLTLAGFDEEDCSQLANRLGATMVIGTPDNLKKLAEDEETIATGKHRVRELRGDYPLSEQAIRWLEEGERGLSSESMFRYFTGMPGLEQGNYPHHISAFRRCRLLLEQVPEFTQQFHKMKGVSVVWAQLVEAWPAICEKMDEEWPSWRTGKFERFGTVPVLAACLLKAALEIPALRIPLADSRMASLGNAVITTKWSRLELACTVYDKTNPLALLGRSFALVRDLDGEIVTSAQQACAVGKIDLAHADDHLIATVPDTP